MPSDTYRLFRQALLTRRQVICSYAGKRREVCPHVLGYKNGQEAALTFQFAGESNSGLPPGGEWRCLLLGQVADAGIRDGAWHTAERHSRMQSCVDIVDLDVTR